MTELNIWNTLLQKKEAFRPIDPQRIRMYVCGPTVYGRAHIGNARPAVVFDVMYRLLVAVYGADCVIYVRNITDIDDKINRKGLEKKAQGDSRNLVEIIRTITDETIQWYHEDMALLGVMQPTYEPRATEFVPQMIAMIERLLAKGNAYESSGHVLFDVNSFDEYGALAKRTLEDMEAGARVEVSPYKRNDLDFVLWKPSIDELPGWDSPWGRGRPGWHIECSAMCNELLGNNFDLHGGGSDLCFPHHENEIAQSKCAFSQCTFANYWVHNGMITVNGRKMSKSLNNFLTIQDLSKKGLSGHEMRLILLGTHYRKQLDWTEEKIVEAKKNISNWQKVLEDNEHIKGEVDDDVLKALTDDLNTPAAFTKIHRLAAEGNVFKLKGSLELLGINPQQILDNSQENSKIRVTPNELSIINKLVSLRSDHRRSKNFANADRIRSELQLCGVIIADKTEGELTEWKLDKQNFDKTKLIRLAKAKQILTVD